MLCWLTITDSHGEEMHGNRKYKWEEWFGRPSTRVVRGVHYYCSQSSMCQAIRNRASQRGLRIRLTDTGNEILIQVRRAGGGATKYPWDEWFAPEHNKDGEQVHEDGSSPLWELERDVTVDGKVQKRDFDVKVEAMPAKIKRAARCRYKIVQISRFDPDGNKLADSLIIKARDMTTEERVAEDLRRAQEKAARRKGDILDTQGRTNG